MREINVATITQNIKEMCIEANHFLTDDMKKVFNQAVDSEKSPLGKQVLCQLKENLQIAGDDMIPMCQDTGMAVVFINVGQEVHLTGGDITGGLAEIPVDLFVAHPSNLSTIPPTQMEIFEDLSTADVARFLVAYLQHYDGLETVFAGVDLKLSFIENYASRRDDIVQTLKESYVNPANENQPIMYCV